MKNRAFRTHDDFLPYLNAKNCIHGGYKSCSWGDEDRKLIAIIKIALVVFLLYGYVFFGE